jgi:hypothetical protein
VSQALSLATGLVGVLVGAYLSWMSTRRHRRTEMVFALHKEYNSIEMVQARYRASALLGKNPKLSYNELRTMLGRVQMQDVWTVVSFYRRLWLMIKHGGVHQKPILELFGDYFTWWYECSFKEQLVPLDIEAALHIRSLKGWLDDNSTVEQMERWVKAAQLTDI